MELGSNRRTCWKLTWKKEELKLVDLIADSPVSQFTSQVAMVVGSVYPNS